MVSLYWKLLDFALLSLSTNVEANSYLCLLQRCYIATVADVSGTWKDGRHVLHNNADYDDDNKETWINTLHGVNG